MDRSLEAGKADEGDVIADTADLAMHLLPHEAKLTTRMDMMAKYCASLQV